MWITTKRPGEDSTRIKVIFLFAYRQGRLHRLRELTWPEPVEDALAADAGSLEG